MVQIHAIRKGLRRPAYALVAAGLFATISLVDATFAQSALSTSVTIPDAMIVSDPQTTLLPNDPATGLTTIDPQTAITVSLDGVSSVDAKSIALVSMVARQVELAKTPDGARQVASTLLDSYNWNQTQMGCLDKLWTSESHWNFQAHNYRSGAQGIAQALPPTKMEVVSLDWRKNPVTQIKWGLSYIKARYGSPCTALSKKHRHGYY
jgi:hypothetical protein